MRIPMNKTNSEKVEGTELVVENTDEQYKDMLHVTPNTDAAVSKVLDSMGSMSIKPIAEKTDDGPSDCQVLIRTMSGSRDRWKTAAEKSGENLSSWIRATLNKAADTVLDCQHPPEAQKHYPWARICTACKMRFSDK